MFTYKNKVTGAVITTYGKVKGADWVQVKDPKGKPAETDKKENEK